MVFFDALKQRFPNCLVLSHRLLPTNFFSNTMLCSWRWPINQVCFYTNILPELGFEHLTIWFDGNFFGVAYPKTMFTSLFIQIHNLFVRDRLIDSRIDVLSSRQGRGMEPDLWSNDYPTNRFCAFIIFYSFVQHCINKLASVCPS